MKQKKEDLLCESEYQNNQSELNNTTSSAKKAITSIFLSLGILTATQAQDLVARWPSTNNITAWQMISKTNNGVSATVWIVDDWWDWVSNVMVKIYNSSNQLIETVQWPSNPDWPVYNWRRVEYYWNSGQWNSCTNWWKDRFFIDDNNNNSYSNPDQCVQLWPLPVELLKFVAACKNDGQQVRYVELKRETASEANNDGFFVQRLVDGKWVNIAFVKWAGNSSEKREYVLIDTEWTDWDDDGVVYYRLEQNDLDGNKDYSDVISVKDCDSGIGYDVVLSPNPVSDVLTVTLKNADNELAHTLYVFNSVWQIVWKVSASDAGKIEFDTSGIPSGIYTIKAIAWNGTDVVTKMFSKI